MRDTQRIPDILREIERVWARHPDMRLCQMIWAAVGLAEDGPEPRGDLFYVEDDIVLNGLKQYRNERPQAIPTQGPMGGSHGH